MLIQESIEIDAPIEKVWGVITDFDSYPQWNTFVVRCASNLIPGDPIDMDVRLGDAPPRAQREWIVSHTPGQEFSYSVKPMPLGAFRSLRSHTLEALPGGRTRYTSRFKIRGWMSPLVAITQGKAMRNVFARMTAGNRQQSEPA